MSPFTAHDRDQLLARLTGPPASPTSLLPSGWPAPLSTRRAAQRAEREALDDKPPSANTLKG
jgi:hypothetical protein